MHLHLKTPLAFFDLETTGTNITQDRIVEIALLKVLPDGTRQVYEQRLNPEKPIPAEASLLHGIYDEDVRDAPSFKQIAQELVQFLHGCDLAGFNVLRFDIPMLLESFLRAEVDFTMQARSVVDAQRIFHLMEKRNLAAAYQFYCGKELVGAHGAMADTAATLEVLDAQVVRYEHQPVTDSVGHVLGVVEKDVAKLHALTAGAMVDFAGRMVYDAAGTVVFNFGKYKGQAVAQILRDVPAYYAWVMRSDFPLDTKQKLTEIKLQAKEERV